MQTAQIGTQLPHETVAHEIISDQTKVSQFARLYTLLTDRGMGTMLYNGKHMGSGIGYSPYEKTGDPNPITSHATRMLWWTKPDMNTRMFWTKKSQIGNRTAIMRRCKGNWRIHVTLSCKSPMQSILVPKFDLTDNPADNRSPDVQYSPRTHTINHSNEVSHTSQSTPRSWSERGQLLLTYFSTKEWYPIIGEYVRNLNLKTVSTYGYITLSVESQLQATSSTVVYTVVQVSSLGHPRECRTCRIQRVCF